MPYILKKYYPTRNIIFFIGEAGLIFITLNLVYIFWDGFGPYLEDLYIYFLRAFVVTSVFQLCLYYFDLYDLSVLPRFSENAAQITLAFGFGCITLSFIYYLFPIFIISTKVFWSGYLTICICIALWRITYLLVLKHKMFTSPIALIGSGELADKIASTINTKKDSGYKIASHSSQNSNKNGITDYSISSAYNRKVCNQMQQLKIEKIVLAFDERRGVLPIQDLLACKLIGGIKVVDGVEFYEELTGKVMVEKINPSSILLSNGFQISFFIKFVKRVSDIFFSLFGLIIASPIMFLSAVIIKLESPGPILYMQKRVGLNGIIFSIIKFRSMVVEAEANGAVWASKTDSRVTRFGRLIRKLRIDEIPQMLNVLKGDMSFVGPRPERPIFVKRLEKNIPYYSLRHAVKPGITGWAQVFYPYGASEEDALRKLEYDLYYIKNLSLGMDMWLIFQTVKIVLFQRGSR